MAMSVVVSQPIQAILGTPCTFVAAVTNSSGSNVNLNMLQPMVQVEGGQLYLGAYVTPVVPSAQQSTASTPGAGYQFIVPIPASSTVNFTFQVVWAVRATGGTATTPDEAYIVSVNCFSDDGSSFSGSAPITELNEPQFGPNPGLPPGDVVIVGQLNFEVPANAVLAL